jgi:hypothetical protein
MVSMGTATSRLPPRRRRRLRGHRLGMRQRAAQRNGRDRSREFRMAESSASAAGVGNTSHRERRRRVLSAKMDSHPRRSGDGDSRLSRRPSPDSRLFQPYPPPGRRDAGQLLALPCRSQRRRGRQPNQDTVGGDRATLRQRIRLVRAGLVCHHDRAPVRRARVPGHGSTHDRRRRGRRAASRLAARLAAASGAIASTTA